MIKTVKMIAKDNNKTVQRVYQVIEKLLKQGEDYIKDDSIYLINEIGQYKIAEFFKEKER